MPTASWLRTVKPTVEAAKFQVSIDSLDACRQLASQVAAGIRAPVCIALTGTLGAGKTQWTRFFAQSLGASEDQISSPTFVLLQQYSTQPPIYHVDAYRIVDEDEFLDIGIEELWNEEAYSVIEWADRFPNLLPKATLWIHFEIIEGRRIVTLSSHSPRIANELRTMAAHFLKDAD
jgi:tRNA threonylcarbamoyladenosine biosynthesis protein TsaE